MKPIIKRFIVAGEHMVKRATQIVASRTCTDHAVHADRSCIDHTVMQVATTKECTDHDALRIANLI